MGAMTTCIVCGHVHSWEVACGGTPQRVQVAASIVTDQRDRPVAAPCAIDGCHYRELERALAEVGRLQQGLRALHWQPIETAPRDGVAFRAYGPSLIHADFNPWGSVEAVYDGEGRLIGAVWDGCHDIWRTDFIEATHWMPLPDAPALLAAPDPPHGAVR